MTLTPRQTEIVRCLFARCTAEKAIARRLGISDCTVKEQLETIRGRLGARTKAHIPYLAVRDGLVRLEDR